MVGFAALVLCGMLAVDDCEGCTEKAVCKPHKEADAEVLKSLKAKLRSEEDGERQAAYQAVADAQRAHANAPSKTLSKSLAKGAVDDSVKVRTACLKNLTEVGDPELAVTTAVEAVTEMPTLLSSMGFGGRGGGRGGGGGAGGGQSDEDLEKIADARAYALQLITSLGSLPDDRCVKALSGTLKALGRRLERELAPLVAQALLDLGARDGVEAVIAKFVAQARAGTGGGGGAGGDGGKALHGMLVRLAVEHEIEETPDWNDEEPADWESWFRRHRKTFPAKLGKVSLASRSAHAE